MVISSRLIIHFKKALWANKDLSNREEGFAIQIEMQIETIQEEHNSIVTKLSLAICN